ncbi:hypothetical protein L1887_37808 [Cichorium endivia]|nr:hypothetical protein L1887_37808 [Cichorium endivia]
MSTCLALAVPVPPCLNVDQLVVGRLLAGLAISLFVSLFGALKERAKGYSGASNSPTRYMIKYPFFSPLVYSLDSSPSIFCLHSTTLLTSLLMKIESS